MIKFIEEGGTIKEASKVAISRKAIIEWKKLKKRTGEIKARTGYHTGHRRVIKDIEKFRKFIEENYDKSSKELARAWVQSVSPSAIIRLLNKLGYSYKKTHQHPKRDIGMRNVFTEKIKLNPKDKLVFIDESGIEDNATIEYGRSLEGTRCYGEKVYQPTVSIPISFAILAITREAPVSVPPPIPAAINTMLLPSRYARSSSAD